MIEILGLPGGWYKSAFADYALASPLFPLLHKLRQRFVADGIVGPVIAIVDPVVPVITDHDYRHQLWLQTL